MMRANEIAWTDVAWSFQGDVQWERFNPRVCVEIEGHRLQGIFEFSLECGIEINLNEWFAEVDGVMRYIRPECQWMWENEGEWKPFDDDLAERLERA
jgi:hypothetical protein